MTLRAFAISGRQVAGRPLDGTREEELLAAQTPVRAFLRHHYPTWDEARIAAVAAAPHLGLAIPLHDARMSGGMIEALDYALPDDGCVPCQRTHCGCRTP